MKKLLLLAFSVLFLSSLQAQPFRNEVSYFKKLDSINPPPEHPILFIGSSSFTNWKDVNSFFPSYPILNRAFGGSSITHLLLYADEIIFKYKPKQIVIYCGENDLTGAGVVTGDSVYQRFRRLHQLIRSKLPGVPVVYVSMKPSPSREKYLPQIIEGNRLIKKYCRKKRHTDFADVFHKMFTDDGKILPGIFLSDNLHMNKKGYNIWQPVLEPYLVK